MCFSATASFAAGAPLLAAGVIALRNAERKVDYAFASIPMLFGVQQLIEGAIWLSFGDGLRSGNAPLTLAYSMFSHVLWPVFIPFAVRLQEGVPWRRAVLAACQLAGLAVGIWLLYLILRFPVTSRVLGSHIAYDSPHFFALGTMLLYLVATCASGTVSRHRLIQVFGMLSLATFIAAYAIHAATFFSVWCFFAAILSFIVYLHFRRRRESFLQITDR